MSLIRGSRSRRTYRSLYGIHTLCSHGNLCKSDTIVGSTTRETRRQIGSNLLLTKSAMHSTEVRINCSFFSPPFSLLQAHVVECTVEMLFALKKMQDESLRVPSMSQLKKDNNKRPAQATIQLFLQFYDPFW